MVGKIKESAGFNLGESTVSSETNSEQTLRRIIDHERERAIQARVQCNELQHKHDTLMAQTQLVSNAFMELLLILEHHNIEVTAEILSPMTYSLIMNLRMRLDD